MYSQMYTCVYGPESNLGGGLQIICSGYDQGHTDTQPIRLRPSTIEIKCPFLVSSQIMKYLGPKYFNSKLSRVLTQLFCAVLYSYNLVQIHFYLGEESEKSTLLKN